MAVNYTLRNPNAPIADTPQERIADQALVNPFVVLKAAGGRGYPLDSSWWKKLEISARNCKLLVTKGWLSFAAITELLNRETRTH